MEKNLCNVKENVEFTINSISNKSFALKRRLLELGFIPNRKVKVIKKSLIKETILVEIEGYLLSLRCSVARMVVVS